MEDDLISRKEAIEYLDKRRTYELMDGRNKAYGKGIRDAIKDIEALPSVPAVPIEPLCRYLEVYARTPIYNMRHTAEWWKEELEKEKWENWTVEQNA